MYIYIYVYKGGAYVYIYMYMYRSWDTPQTKSMHNYNICVALRSTSPLL